MGTETIIDKELMKALRETNSTESDIKGIFCFCGDQVERQKLLEYIQEGHHERKEIMLMSSQIALENGHAEGDLTEEDSKYSMDFHITDNEEDSDNGDFSPKRGNLINDLELIVRHNIEGNAKNNILRNPSTSRESIQGLVYNEVNVPLYIGKALMEILDYLERRYNVNFDD